MKILLGIMFAYDDPEKFEVAFQIADFSRKQLKHKIDCVFYFRKHEHAHFLFYEKAMLLKSLLQIDGYDYYGILDTDVIVRNDAAERLISIIETHPDAWLFCMDECTWGGYNYLGFKEFFKRLVGTFNLNGIAVDGVYVYVNAGLIVFKASIGKELMKWWEMFLRNGLYKDGWLEQHALSAVVHFLGIRDKYVSLSPDICAFADKQPFDAPFVHIFASTQFHRLKEFVLKLKGKLNNTKGGERRWS